MARKKRRNYIEDGKAQKFLWDAYGLRTKRVNHYHIKVWHEEHDGWFDWYHTTGSVVKTSRGSNGEYYPSKFGYALDDETLAIKIIKSVHDGNSLQNQDRTRIH